MANSLDLTNAVAYQAYVQKYAPELYTKMMLGFSSAQYANPLEGVKGRITLSEMIIGDLFRRFNVDFDAVAGTVGVTPRTLTNEKAKAEVSVAPTEFESAYIGFLRKTGQDPQDFPFQAYMFDNGIFPKMHQEQEIAFWQGVKTGAPASTDKLIALTDGGLHQIADAITATDITPYTTASLTNSNILGHVESMYALIGDQWKGGMIHVHMSWANFIKLKQNYRADVSKYTGVDTSKTSEFMLDIGNVKVIATPGMGSSNRIVMTTAANIQYVYDGPSDDDLMNFEWNKRKLEGWSDIWFGMGFLWLDDASGAIVVNDLT